MLILRSNQWPLSRFTSQLKYISVVERLWNILAMIYFIDAHVRSNNTAYLLTLLSYLLTPWSRVLLEKLTGFQLVKKFTSFYRTRRFITAFTCARHLFLSYASSIQSIPPHPTSWRSILLLSSHLRLGLPSCLFPLRFPHQNPVYTSPLPPHALHALPISFFSILSPEQYWVSSTDH